MEPSAPRLLILLAAVLFAVAACCFGGIISGINGWTFITGGVSAVLLAYFFGWPWPARTP